MNVYNFRQRCAWNFVVIVESIIIIMITVIIIKIIIIATITTIIFMIVITIITFNIPVYIYVSLLGRDLLSPRPIVNLELKTQHWIASHMQVSSLGFPKSTQLAKVISHINLKDWRLNPRSSACGVIGQTIAQFWHVYTLS